MKHSKLDFKVVLIGLLLVAFVLSLDAVKGGSQSPYTAQVNDRSGEPKVKATAAFPERLPNANTDESETSVYAAAIRKNLSLHTELKWTFGGKQQLGWYLYTPLIKRLIDTEDDPGSASFAAALASWQKVRGLRASGILDEQSFNAMVSHWQAQRLKQRSYAQPDQLSTAPPSDFYDPTRPEELRQVERETYAAYKRMVSAAIADPLLKLAVAPDGELASGEKYLKIISSFRSREYQEKLRRQSPHVGRAGLAINSPHFTGRALDLYVGGEPVETKDPNRAIQVQTPVYRWLVANADRFGFRPYFYEPWHWEYVR